jgi:hypothetical protein
MQEATRIGWTCLTKSTVLGGASKELAKPRESARFIEKPIAREVRIIIRRIRIGVRCTGDALSMIVAGLENQNFIESKLLPRNPIMIQTHPN